MQLMALSDDQEKLVIWEDRKPVEYTVADLVKIALEQISSTE